MWVVGVGGKWASCVGAKKHGCRAGLWACGLVGAGAVEGCGVSSTDEHPGLGKLGP